VIETIAAWMQYVFEALAAATEISPWVYLLVAFGGVASAISPCYVPVLAMFAGYVGGYARASRTAGLQLALPFVLGNAVALAAVGAVASFMGQSALQLFTGYQLDRWIPGLVGIAMGFQLVGILKLKMPVVPIFRWARQPGTGVGSLALGLPFGLVVTPCTIPIFFAIVTFVALHASVLHGAFLMVAYALGRGVVLGAVAVSVSALKAFDIARSSVYLERLSGILILAISVGLLFFYEEFARYALRTMSM
jgi:cytochrome c-type biogenesis protein